MDPSSPIIFAILISSLSVVTAISSGNNLFVRWPPWSPVFFISAFLVSVVPF